MWRLMILATLQSLMLCGGQVFLKLALTTMPPFGWNKTFWTSALTNWQFATCGILFGGASLLWMYMLKHFPLSTVYPLVSLSYVFGMLAAIVVLHEEVTLLKWTGVAFIIIGCILVLDH